MSREWVKQITLKENTLMQSCVTASTLKLSFLLNNRVQRPENGLEWTQRAPSIVTGSTKQTLNTAAPASTTAATAAAPRAFYLIVSQSVSQPFWLPAGSCTQPIHIKTGLHLDACTHTCKWCMPAWNAITLQALIYSFCYSTFSTC